MLWFLLERRLPFPLEMDKRMFVMDITNDIRPPVPVDWPDDIKLLIQHCWDTKAANRPSFYDVYTSISVLVLFLIDQ